jgi:hypothetical protein
MAIGLAKSISGIATLEVTGPAAAHAAMPHDVIKAIQRMVGYPFLVKLMLLEIDYETPYFLRVELHESREGNMPLAHGGGNDAFGRCAALPSVRLGGGTVRCNLCRKISRPNGFFRNRRQCQGKGKDTPRRQFSKGSFHLSVSFEGLNGKMIAYSLVLHHIQEFVVHPALTVGKGN